MILKQSGNMNKYKYTISDLAISLKSDVYLSEWYSDKDSDSIEYIYSNEIKSLTIINDYRNNVIPYMLLNACVNKDKYEKITKNMAYLIGHLKVSYGKTTGNNDDSVEYNKPYIDGVYKIANQELLDSRIVSKLRSSMISENDDVEITANNESQHTIDISIFLFDYETLIKLRKCNSYLITGTYNDIIYKLMKDRGFSNFLMSPINDSEQHYFSIPTGTLIENLDYIDDKYGIYDAPYTFFADNRCVYMIDLERIGESESLSRGEVPTVIMYLDRSDIATGSDTGSTVVNDDGDMFAAMNIEPYITEDTDTLMDFYQAHNITTVIRGRKEVYTSKLGNPMLQQQSDGEDHGYDIERIYAVNNPKANAQLKFKINEYKRVIQSDFYDIDINILTPNKKYKIIADEFYDLYTDDNGYRLYSMVSTFARQADGEYRCGCHCEFSCIRHEPKEVISDNEEQ